MVWGGNIEYLLLNATDPAVEVDGRTAERVEVEPMTVALELETVDVDLENVGTVRP